MTIPTRRPSRPRLSPMPMTQLFVNYTSRAMNEELTPQAAMDGLQKELEELYARTPDMYPAAS